MQCPIVLWCKCIRDALVVNDDRPYCCIGTPCIFRALELAMNGLQETMQMKQQERSQPVWLLDALSKVILV